MMEVLNVPNIPEQKRVINEAESKYNDLKQGQKWYAIPAKWWESWKSSGEETDPKDLGKIDISELYDETLRGLKTEAQENQDYELVNEQVWKYLSEWYEASKAISGDVVLNPAGKPIIDIHPARFRAHFIESDNEESSEESETERNSDSDPLIVVSRYHKMIDLKIIVAKKWKLPVEQVKIFLRPPDQDKWLLMDESDEADMDQTIGEALPNIGLKCWDMKVNKLDLESHIVESEFSASNPTVGQRLDAKNKKNQWLEAEIVDVDKENKTVKVHFLSFEPKDDEEFPVDSENLKAPFSKVPDWRIQLRVGDEVEINKSLFGEKSKSSWVVAEVKKIDRSGKALKRLSSSSDDSQQNDGGFFSKLKFTGSKKAVTPKVEEEVKRKVSKHGLVKVRYYPNSGGWLNRQYKDVVIDLGSEDIAHEYTHLEKKTKRSYVKNTTSKPEFEGVVGLKNLGNTCYMNSSLQCLLATGTFSEYFTSDDYKKDLNRRNPLGYGGKIAEAYADLTKDIFSDQYATIAPDNIKKVVHTCLPSFAGWGQHDSHEFTVRFLDGLHEDLNRVKNKPVTEAPESEGKPDSVVAKISWDNHKLRNQSIIVDQMHGLMKSHLTCPQCNNQATKFDPFSCWSVPLPVSNNMNLHVVLVSNPMKGKPKATRYIMEAINGVKAKSVVEWLEEKSGVSIDNLVLAELRSNKIDSTLYKPGMKRVKAITTRAQTVKEVVAFELPSVEMEEEAKAEDKKSQDGESSGDEEAFFSYLELHYKPDRGNTYRVFRVCDVIRFKNVTNAEIHDMVWEYAKNMFDLEDQEDLKPEDLYTLHYTNKKIPSNDKPFSRSTRYNGDRIDVKILKQGFDILVDDMSKEGTNRSAFGKRDLEMMDEDLNIGQVEHDETVQLAVEKADTVLTLEKCFEKFGDPEVLDEDDMWYCNKCKEHVRATKKMDVYSAGDIICIHLKRFRDGRYRRREKIDDFVEYPINGLDLNEYIAGDTNSDHIYDLYATSNHMGGLGGGHYIAKIKTKDGWFQMNDSAVSKISDEKVEDSVVTETAYLLYYKKRQ